MKQTNEPTNKQNPDLILYFSSFFLPSFLLFFYTAHSHFLGCREGDRRSRPVFSSRMGERSGVGGSGGSGRMAPSRNGREPAGVTPLSFPASFTPQCQKGNCGVRRGESGGGKLVAQDTFVAATAAARDRLLDNGSSYTGKPVARTVTPQRRFAAPLPTGGSSVFCELSPLSHPHSFQRHCHQSFHGISFSSFHLFHLVAF